MDFEAKHVIEAIKRVNKKGAEEHRHAWLYANYPAPGQNPRESRSTFVELNGQLYPMKPLGRFANELAGTTLEFNNPHTHRFKRHFKELGFKVLVNGEEV